MNIEKIIARPLRKADLILFLSLICLAVVLFIAVGIGRTKSSSGFKVLVDNEVVCTFSFDDNKMNVVDNKQHNIEKINDFKYKIYSEFGYNVIEIDIKEKDVYVLETDCGSSGECKQMRLKNGSIICIPHRMAVVPIDGRLNLKIG